MATRRQPQERHARRPERSRRRRRRRRIPLPTIVLSIAILILSLASVDSCGSASYGDYEFGDGVEQTMDSNARHIYQAFHEYGLTDEQIAGMLSNLQEENGIDPTAVEGIYDEPYRMDGPRKSQIASGGEQGLSTWTRELLTDVYHATYDPATNTMGPGVTDGMAVNSSFYGPSGSDGLFYCGVGMGSWTGANNVRRLLEKAKSVNMNWWDLDYQVAALIALPGSGESPNEIYPRYKEECANKSAWECAEWFLTNWERSPGVRVEEHCSHADTWLKRIRAWKPNSAYGRSTIRLANRLI